MRGTLLTSFKIREKEYLCFLVDDKIVYRVKSNGKISNNFSKREKVLMDRIFPKILVSNRPKDDIVNFERADLFVDSVAHITDKIQKVLVGFAIGSILTVCVDPALSRIIPYSHNAIVKELDKNEELSEEEAEYFKDCLVVLDDNEKYVNQRLVSSRMKNIDCRWYYGFDSKSSGLEGFYSDFGNYISVRATSYENMDAHERHYLTHEIIHSFVPARLFGRSLDEAITEQLTAEYLSIESIIYGEPRIYLTALSEIIGTEPLLQFYFGGSFKPIKKALNGIIDDDKKVETLIDNMDIALDNSKSFEKYNSEENKELIREIYDSLDDYFYTKYGYHMNEDAVMANLFINSGLCDVENKSYIQDIICPYIGGLFTESYANKNGTTGFYYYGSNGEILKQGIVSQRIVPKKDNAKKLYLKYDVSEE